ncbi:hypothetical protein EVAR_2415_1 [Eumeta japonica]|uniref:Uncharacterized protein n=1 Tax=Eumeta variegata TaxID=151549 RepID=A0A4C1SP29_EUMVA|nr:hypothetical protein EVAR_2415_1 [Eumeta japonica]
MRDDRARLRAIWRRHRHDSRNNGSNHCHLIRRGRIPDEKTPGHEAKYKSSMCNGCSTAVRVVHPVQLLANRHIVKLG